MDWDVAQKKLVITPISKELISWMISVFVFLNMLNTASLCLLLGKLFGFVQVSLLVTLGTLGWLLSSTFGFLLEVLVCKFDKNGTLKFPSTLPPSPDWKGIARNKLIDLIIAQGFILYICVVLIYRLDPYYQLESILPDPVSLPVKFLLHLFRVTMWIPISQVARISVFIVSTTIIATHLALGCISALDKAASSRETWKNRASIDTHLLNYASCQLVFGIGYDFVTLAIATGQFTCPWFSVVFNFISLKMYPFVDTSIYVYAPLIAGIVLVGMEIMVPLCTKIYQDCKEIHATWRRGMVGVKNDAKYLRKKLRSIQVIALYGGINSYNFYKCKKSTKSTYFGAVIDYTMTATLSIDTKSLHF
ncbi:hypothetical protein Fcan01_24933 [Folsomia candida]|uniref:Uncharacterized protein n=1 Tax=Folsomia candida TaxID=158441 RepID=A0A226D5R8_FOLCA|nr:hypothetical protein Fcan01_24933 [Folsomia candida]